MALEKYIEKQKEIIERAKQGKFLLINYLEIWKY